MNCPHCGKKISEREVARHMGSKKKTVTEAVIQANIQRAINRWAKEKATNPRKRKEGK